MFLQVCRVALRGPATEGRFQCYLHRQLCQLSKRSSSPLYNIYIITVVNVSGHEYPESISRVQDLTGKQVTFYEADITSKDSLRQVSELRPAGNKRIFS